MNKLFAYIYNELTSKEMWARAWWIMVPKACKDDRFSSIYTEKDRVPRFIAGSAVIILPVIGWILTYKYAHGHGVKIGLTLLGLIKIAEIICERRKKKKNLSNKKTGTVLIK